MSGVAPGIRFATAATAFATVPFTVALALASLVGFLGLASRFVLRVAAALAAVFFLTTFDRFGVLFLTTRLATRPPLRL
jgi:hypothetical protein